MGTTEQAHSFTKFTQRTHRTTLVIAIVMLVVLLVALANIALAPETFSFDADGFFEMRSEGAIWITAPIHLPQLVILFAGVSVFSLVVRYKGGRSGRKFFNDRTIENNKLHLPAISSVTTLLRVVICFPTLFLARVRKIH